MNYDPHVTVVIIHPKYTLNLKWSQKTWEGEKPQVLPLDLRLAKMRMGKSERTKNLQTQMVKPYKNPPNKKQIQVKKIKGP